jgi:hypothetical protein
MNGQNGTGLVLMGSRTLTLLGVLCLCVHVHATAEVIQIGGRLEPMVDEFLIDQMAEGARLELHRPIRCEIVFKTDAPWEGNASAYQSVFKDGALYRMYYRGGHYRHGGKPAEARESFPWVLCYAESDDGIHWRRPKLGICEFEGSTENNIVVDMKLLAKVNGCPAHTATFLDTNPKCPPDERYKIVTVGSKPHGLFVLKSADGLHFSLMNEKPFQTTGALDSQNLAFYDTVRGEYREYHRGFKGAVRGIMTATSKDILRFPKPEWLEYPGAPVQALYTNQIQPYYRAPHIFIGFPMRYNRRGWSDAMLDLPGQQVRIARAKVSPRYGTVVTDAAFMTSRDGVRFKRWSEAFIRPGPSRKDTWVYGDNFVFWGLVETKSHLENAPDEISLYATEGYWESTYTSVRRYTLRVDGFVSVHAPFSGGEIVTKPLLFDGGNLALNVETSAAGSIQVEIQDADGKPIKGYSLEDCPQIFGDNLRTIVRWENKGGDVRPLSGKPVRLRFLLKDADLYSFQFVPYAPEPKRPDLTRAGGTPKKNPDRKTFVALKDDFQSIKAGIAPTDDDLDPPSAGEKSGWFTPEGSPNRVQVLRDDPIGSGKAGTNHYLKVERRDEPGRKGGRAWVRLAPRDIADNKNGIVEVKVRVYVPSKNKYCVDIDAYDNEPDHYSHRAFHVRFFRDGTVKYYAGEKHHEVPNMVIKLDAWQDVLIRADLKAATFDLTVQGQTARGLPFANPNVHRIKVIGFCPNTNNCTMYVDDAEVKIEP